MSPSPRTPVVTLSRTLRAGLVVTALALLAAGVLTTLSAVRSGVPGLTRTQVGTVEVTGVETLGGLTARDLSSTNHGISHLVAAGQVQVQVTLRITNDTGGPVSYSAGLFRLAAGQTAPVAAMSSTLPDGRLGAGVRVEGTLGFVAPADGSVLRLYLPGTDAAVSLSRTGTSAPEPDHHH